MSRLYWPDFSDEEKKVGLESILSYFFSDAPVIWEYSLTAETVLIQFTFQNSLHTIPGYHTIQAHHTKVLGRINGFAFVLRTRCYFEGGNLEDVVPEAGLWSHVPGTTWYRNST